MTYRLSALFACLVLALPAAAAPVLRCAQDDLYSKSVLKRAPLGAARVSKYVLTVNWQHGTREFRDQPPYDTGLGGAHYAYCSYNADAHLHLIRKNEGGLFSGVLLNDDTGAVLPGGQTVSVSPDLSTYLARRLRDGLDGEEWAVLRTDGSVLWQGKSGFLDDDGLSWLATLEAPHWSQDNILQATLICTAHQDRPHPHKTPVTLESKDGSYQWWPKVVCPRPKAATP